MRRWLTLLPLLATSCFSAPESTSGATTGGVTGAVGSTGRTTSTTAASGTSGTTLASTSGTTGGSSGATTGGTSGTTGMACTAQSFCPDNGACVLSVTPCAGDSTVVVSSEGVCETPVVCSGPDGCQGKACSSNDDCDVFTQCSGGICQGFACAEGVPFCPGDCTFYTKPHSCEVDCLCGTCPLPDAGNIDCDVNNPCPSGSDCIFTTELCPPSGSMFSGDSTSPGGTCVPEKSCGPGICEDQPCVDDFDCGTFEQCIFGACQALLCPPVADTCGPGCALETNPHSCAPFCICPSCPAADGGINPIESDGGGTCDPSTCIGGTSCCGDRCVNLDADTQNCGVCGKTCSDGEVCMQGGCTQPQCSAFNCGSDDAGNPSTCCGDQCCGAGSICCFVESNISAYVCADAAVGCPVGCPFCN